MGGVVAESDQVAARLGRRVGRTGPERVRLGEGPFLDRAVHLVGGDVQESVDADLAGDLAQHIGAQTVGAHELVGGDDGPVDVALGREVDDRVVAVHGRADRVTVADVAVDEAQASIALQVGQVVAVAGVGQGVEHGDLVVRRPEHQPGVVGADEPGGAGDEQLHGQVLMGQ